jgi:hypothetical protein
MSLLHESSKIWGSLLRLLERYGCRLTRVDLQQGMSRPLEDGSFMLFGFAGAAPFFLIPGLQSFTTFTVKGSRHFNNFTPLSNFIVGELSYFPSSIRNQFSIV